MINCVQRTTIMVGLQQMFPLPASLTYFLCLWSKSQRPLSSHKAKAIQFLSNQAFPPKCQPIWLSLLRVWLAVDPLPMN